jgi:hypothetical protein
MAVQSRQWATRLTAFDPIDVASACAEWRDSKNFWPDWKDLLSLVQEHERLRRFAATPRLPAPASEEPGRNKTDEAILAMWERNDELGQDMVEHPERYHGGELGATLRSVFAGFEAKRWTERPDLAARYYGREQAA